MASYADMAAKGPKQSDEEVCLPVPHQVPEILHDDSGVHSLDSLNSFNDHVQSMPSNVSYADQQLASERAEEQRQEAKRFADEVAKEAKDFINMAEHDIQQSTSNAKSKVESYSRTAEHKFELFKGDAKEAADRAGKAVKKDASKAKKSAKEAEEWAEKNKKNPVVVGNVVVLGALAALLGTGAYRMHRANTLTWNVVGAWAGAVGLFAVGDYYVSNFLFKKYPPKN